MIALLLGLLSTDLLAREMSAVTLVMDILEESTAHTDRSGICSHSPFQRAHTTKQALTRFHRSYGIMKEQLERSAG